MDHELMVERLFEALINGDRPGVRGIVDDASRGGLEPRDLVTDLFWPTYTLIERLHREDNLTTMCYQLATRLLRATVDRVTGRLPIAPANGRTVFACCGPSDGDELGAQMATDLIESSGFSVRFAGGKLPADEILAQVHESRPDILLLFASGPSDLPGIRHLVDTLREINAVPNLKVAVGGGVFNRAAGLAEEIGIHLFAPTPMDMVNTLVDPEAERIIEERPLAPTKRRKKAA